MHEDIRCRVNGEPVSQVTVTDRGLQFGDGLFETIAVLDGKPVWLQRHLDRLSDGCQHLRFSSPPDMQLLADEAVEFCAGQQQAVLKIILTRGSSTGGYSVPKGATPNRIMLLKSASRHSSEPAETGIHAGICQQRIAASTTLAGIKHLNRLEQVLARMECEGRWQEGIMLDTSGHVIEGTMSNVFLVRDSVLVTPVLDNAGIRGITRDMIMEIAASNAMANIERNVSPEELFEADEIFVCNSLIGIWPVVQIDEHRLNIGDVTRHLQQTLTEVMC